MVNGTATAAMVWLMPSRQVMVQNRTAYHEANQAILARTARVTCMAPSLRGQQLRVLAAGPLAGQRESRRGQLLAYLV